MTSKPNDTQALTGPEAESGHRPVQGMNVDLPGDQPMPLVITPERAGSRSLAAMTQWAQDHMQFIDEALLGSGAVLLRGFELSSAEDFGTFGNVFPAYTMGYEAGATPRNPISGKVFEATRVPRESWIMLHQEMAYMRSFPLRIAFYCNSPPERGGETTIGDMRRFTAALPEAFLLKLAAEGVCYRRNYLSPDCGDVRRNPRFAHQDWEAAFYTNDRETVEQACRARGLNFAWEPDGGITTSINLPGTRVHPRTGETLYFNQLHTQTPHRRWMGDEVWAAYVAAYGGGAPKPFDACFGDGAPLEDADLMAIYDALDAITVSFPWQQGDVMILDNLLTGHGRNPYVGERDVQVMLLN